MSNRVYHLPTNPVTNPNTQIVLRQRPMTEQDRASIRAHLGAVRAFAQSLSQVWDEPNKVLALVALKPLLV